jgi:hypothetical protein
MSDPLTLDLNFTFQGGGAKLGSLIATADAVHGLRRPLGYRIESVAGSSAGAIAAAILATNKPPGLFRDRIKAIGPDFIEKVTPKKNMLSSIVRAYSGLRLADRNALEAFFEQLFHIDGANFENVSDLPIPISIFVTDMRSRAAGGGNAVETRRRLWRTSVPVWRRVALPCRRRRLYLPRRLRRIAWPKISQINARRSAAREKSRHSSSRCRKTWSMAPSRS